MRRSGNNRKERRKKDDDSSSSGSSNNNNNNNNNNNQQPTSNIQQQQQQQQTNNTRDVSRVGRVAVLQGEAQRGIFNFHISSCSSQSISQYNLILSSKYRTDDLIEKVIFGQLCFEVGNRF
jgi:hypothetical protein